MKKWKMRLAVLAMSSGTLTAAAAESPGIASVTVPAPLNMPVGMPVDQPVPANPPAQGAPATVAISNPVANSSCPAPAFATAIAEPLPSSTFWLSGGAMLWQIKRAPLPIPIATSGDNVNLGVLGFPGTGVLLGGNTQDYKNFLGGRVGGGVWLDGSHQSGIEGSLFLLEERAVGNSVGGAGIVSRPFFDPNIGFENVRLVNLPGAFAGGVAYSTSSSMWGGDVNGFTSLSSSASHNLKVLAGFRYMNLTENLTIADQSTIAPGAGAVSFNGTDYTGPITTALSDRFTTSNDFYGAQLGTSLATCFDRVVLEVSGKVALGFVHEVTNAEGSSTIFGAGPVPMTVRGGLLATGNALTRRDKDTFAVLPEVGAKLGYKLTENVIVSVGYTGMYLSRVVRPGDQIDRTVNPTLIPTSPSFGLPFGPPRPQAEIHQTDFYAHGVTLGMVVKY